METIELLFFLLLGIAGTLFIEYNKLKKLTLIYKNNYLTALKVIGELDPSSAQKMAEIIKKEMEM